MTRLSKDGETIYEDRSPPRPSPPLNPWAVIMTMMVGYQTLLEAWLATMWRR